MAFDFKVAIAQIEQAKQGLLAAEAQLSSDPDTLPGREGAARRLASAFQTALEAATRCDLDMILDHLEFAGQDTAQLLQLEAMAKPDKQAMDIVNEASNQLVRAANAAIRSALLKECDCSKG